METYRIKEVTKAFNISNDAVHSYIRKALPEGMKPKKTIQEGLGRETYEFTVKDMHNLKKAIKLKATGLTYKQVKDTMKFNACLGELVEVVADEIENLEESEEIMGTDLTIINQGGKLLVDSREVAKMIDRDHHKVMRDMRGYADVLDINPDLDTSSFFIESTFKDSYDRKQPCYLLTRKGCDMVANKMTGEKGIIFTAKYVTKFEEMEKQQQAPQMGHLSPQLQLLISMELKQSQIEAAVTKTKQEVEETKREVENTKQQIQEMKDVIIINPRTEWRQSTNKILLAVGRKMDDYAEPKRIAYEALQERARCRPNVLVRNLQNRALGNGMAPSKASKLNLLDVLENDPRLKEIYIEIVKAMANKYL